MLGQTPFPEEKTPVHLQLEAEALSQDGASGRRTRFLWTGVGFAALMLLGISARALHTHAPHASAVAPVPRPELAFVPGAGVRRAVPPARIGFAEPTAFLPGSVVPGSHSATFGLHATADSMEDDIAQIPPSDLIRQRSDTAVFTMSADTETIAKPPPSDLKLEAGDKSKITKDNPLRVVIAGAGVGGLALANDLLKDERMHVSILEKTASFKRFGGPIQLASNALQVMKTTDEKTFNQIMEKFTYTGDKENGIKDGIRDEWYAKFDLGGPAESRGMPYTGVIERPDLQEIYLNALPEGVVQNGDGIATYKAKSDGSVTVVTESGAEHQADVVIGADGIWSNVRATMRDKPAKGDGSGASYSGYTVFAGELNYASPDNGKVGYKVYIGPGQYFVITDIGKGRYQWYAFLARAPDSAETQDKPDGSVAYLKTLFTGWSPDIHAILDVTREDEIGQRDLYDRPPSVIKPWTDGHVALLGDAIHAMMPNLGQGGCQALEDSFVISQELKSATDRSQINDKLQEYRNRRVVRASTVQGLSRFASDIIINGFDTPAKIVIDGGLKFENFNYAGVVTKLLQPILPIFFNVQFNFLYSGWANEAVIDYKAAVGIALIGFSILTVAAGGAEIGAEAGVGLGMGLEALFGGEAFAPLAEAIAQIGEGFR